MIRGDPARRHYESEETGGYKQELWHLRRQCRQLKMEECYNRYVERLVVTNVSLFLIIMEFLLLVHIFLIWIASKKSVFLTIPYIFMMICLPLILSICFKDRRQYENFNYLNNMASYGVALLMCFMDTFVFLLVEKKRAYLVCCYDHILIVSIYMLLPIGFFGCPSLLGIGVSCLYLVFSWCNLYDNDLKGRSLLMDLGYWFILNFMMIIYQAGMEYRFRQTVLSRRQLLHQNLLLKVVVQREKNIIQSILPTEIAHSLQQEIRSRIEDKVHGTFQVTPRVLFVELHSDVSILVADMVNYTYLTTKLDVEDLVQILHELFLKFDTIAEQNNVLRIKFLGDSYNCVAGIPIGNRRHAKCCVALGLEMILEMNNLRYHRDLDINMRIGVHSGELFSGIIGRTKWQYDIWSRDVDIATRLENTGLAGAVHISQTTLSLLDDTYEYTESSERIAHDPNLCRAHVSSYLIYPQERHIHMNFDLFSLKTKHTSSTSSSINMLSLRDGEMEMDEIRLRTQRDMMERVECMPVGRIQLARIFDFSKAADTDNEDNLFRPHISAFWRLFRDSNIEWSFMNQTDILIKYSLSMVLFVAFGFYILHMIQPYYSSKYYLKMGTLLLLIMIIAIFGYFKTFWWKMITHCEWAQKKCFLIQSIFRVSLLIEEELIVRLFASFCSIFLIYLMATMETIGCDPNELQLFLTKMDVANNRFTFICFDPWFVTHNVIVVLSLIFFFHGIPLVFKICLLVFMCVSHLLTIYAFSFAWKRSETTNIGLPAEYGHIWYLIAYSLLVFIKEQHVAYITKVNFHSKLRYEDKLKQTENSTRSISIIMTNILPVHVANIFLDGGYRNELFYENYSKVAVMFAHIHNVEADRGGLRVLNEYICYYDDLLEEYNTSTFKVEKIKVIGWTYMAACGLLAENLSDFYKPKEKHRTYVTPRERVTRISSAGTSENEFDVREPHFARYAHPELKHDDNCVLTMVRFAQDMLIIMQDIAKQNIYEGHGCSLRGQLQIGISHGPVMAGVVGLSPPHYDIWGHTVNMASRMSSTGVLDSIHVTENTAKVLRQFDIRCDYRGQTTVKGIGQIPTYLVGLSDTLNFQYNDDYDLNNINIVNTDRQMGSNTRTTITIDMGESITEPETPAEPDMSEKGTQTKRRKRH